MLAKRCAFVLALLLLAGTCSEEQVAAPAPETLTREAIGYYCNMIVADHQGPKAQIFLEGRAEPIWFSSVRDAVAFTLLPEEPKSITGFYVNDMGRASWEAPEAGTWIAAEGAHFVIESDRHGGMGAKEAVPFADPESAKAFIARHGGRTVGLGEIPTHYILSSDEEAPTHQEGHGGQGHQHDGS